MMYGNSSMGYGYSPDRSRDVDHNNLRSQFLNTSGNKQNGYYYSTTSSYQSSKPNGHYDGRGQWVKD